MMRKSKRERLEAKGWRFGSAREFLGRSDEESAYVEPRARLAKPRKRRKPGPSTWTGGSRRPPTRRNPSGCEK